MTVRLETGRLRRCFSTLGCVELSLPEICELAQQFNIPGIELRGFNSRMDMAECAAEQGLGATQLQELFEHYHTRPIVAGSSLKLTSASKEECTGLMTLCAWANELGIPYVRVFGGGTWGKPITESELDYALQLVHFWFEERDRQGWQLELLLETHDAFSGSEPCLQLNRSLERPLGLIWDSHHTWRLAGEAPEFTWQQIGRFVRHVHVKDSVDRPSARHPYTYVLPGEGQMPLQDVFALLERERFEGFVSLEWERHWHPYLPPLREALERFAGIERACRFV